MPRGLCCAYLLLGHLESRLEIKDIDGVQHDGLAELLPADHDPARGTGMGHWFHNQRQPCRWPGRWPPHRHNYKRFVPTRGWLRRDASSCFVLQLADCFPWQRDTQIPWPWMPTCNDLHRNPPQSSEKESGHRSQRGLECPKARL